MLTWDAERLSFAGESVRWDELRLIELHTSSDGPFYEDVFYVLHGERGTGVVVPSGAAHQAGLLERLQQLPRFDNQGVMEAMACTGDRVFEVWRRPCESP